MSEAALQKTIVQYLGYACPDVLTFSVPNGFYAGEGKNKFAHIANMKATGLVPGIPDLCLLWANCGMCMIEVKSPSGGRVSPEQKALHERLKGFGVPVFIVRSMPEIYEIIRELKIPTIAKPGTTRAMRSDAAGGQDG